MMKKQHFITAALATGILLPLAAQTILKMPEMKQPDPRRLAQSMSARTSAAPQPGMLSSMADSRALEHYAEVNGSAPATQMFFSPDGPEDDTMYTYTGFNVAAGDNNGTPTGGLVNFNLSPFACDTVSSHSGVSPYSYMKQGKLNCILFTQDWTGKFLNTQRTVYDANTLEFEDIFTTDVPHDGIKSYVPYILTYDDQKDVIYCVTIGDDGNGGEGYYLNIYDETSNTVKRIGYLGSYKTGKENKDQYTVKALCAGYGTLYALVNSDATYLAKINPATCETIIIGRTELPTDGQFGLQPMIYDSMMGRLLVNHYNFYDGTVYYNVSTWDQGDGTVKTELLEKAPTGFSFFYKRPETERQMYPYALQPIEDLNVTSLSDTELSVDFTVPALLSDGSEIEYPTWVQDFQKSVNVYVYVDGNYMTVTGFPQTIDFGSHITGNIDLTTSYTPIEPGLHTVTVAITPKYNEIATLRNSSTLVVGDDVPGLVQNISATSSGNTVTITWDAPAETRFADFGTTLDLSNATYTVVRDIDGTVVAENISETSCTDTIENEEFTGYTYTIYAAAGGRNGQGAVSPRVFCGSYLPLPYTNEFADIDCLEGWTILNLDNNGTYRTWQYNQYQHAINSGWGSGDDWLITPPLRLKKDEVYELKMNINGYGTLNICYGTETNAGSMTNRLATLERTHDTEPYIFCFSPEADGEYRIGIHCYNANINESGWTLHDFSFRRAATATAPAMPTEAAFTPVADGEYNGSISAIMPSTAVDGSALQTIAAFVAYDAEGNEIGRNAEVAPGSGAEIEYAAQHGWNYITVAAVDENGEGYPVMIKTYVGSDIAKPVTNLKAVWGAEKNQAVISWDVPTEGVNGGWIDADNLSYKVYQYLPSEWPDRRLLAEIFENEVDLTILDNDKQDQYVFSVTAVTAEGESEYANGSIVLGTPYTLPIAEPFDRDGMKIAPYITTTLAGQGGWTVDGDFYNANIHPQNNDGVQLIYVNQGTGEGSGRISTPIIDFTDAKSPVLTIWAHHSEGMDEGSYLSIDASTDGNTRDCTPLCEPISLSGNNGWQLHSIDLSALCGKKAHVGITAHAADPKDRVYVDNYAIREADGNDLAITGITATRYEKSGETLGVKVTVANLGAETAPGYIVLFNVNDATVGEQEISEALAAGAEATVNFELPLTAADNGVTTYYAELLYDGDSNEDNNVSDKRTVTLIERQLPAPQHLSANDLDLSWDAPAIDKGHEVTLDFENVPAFTADDIEGWTTHDGDGHKSIGFIQYYNNYWPYNGQPLAWMVWGTKEAGCAGAQMWEPYEGDHCLIAWGNYGLDDDNRDNTSEPEDDWFISPEILGGSDFSFMTLGNDMACIVEVLTSSTDRNPESFTNKVTSIDYPTVSVWKEVVCTLPDDARYVALHVIANGFGIMVDNIRYTDARTPQLEGYNLYCGPVLQSFTGQTSAKAVKDGSYAVSALYDLGESPLSNVAAVSGVSETVAESSMSVITGKETLTVAGAEGKTVSVVSAQGVVYYNATADGTLTLSLPAGIYVVKAGDNSVKAVVK